VERDEVAAERSKRVAFFLIAFSSMSREVGFFLGPPGGDSGAVSPPRRVHACS
jgi:hypothetical protein